MTTRATGSFDVKLNPMAPDAGIEGTSIGRLSIDKQYRGDLVATSKGQMIASSSTVKGSAGYVAMEHVTGTLQGRPGTFVLQHSGTMNRGAPTLSVSVVPDSGTDQLVGLAGALDIIIADGKHSYVLEYVLPAS
jgi:hypothetical protein